MSKYTKTSTSSPVTLLTSSTPEDTGIINSVHITNESVDTSNTVSLSLSAVDSSVSLDGVYIIKNVNIPFGTTLVLDSVPNFNIQQYNLKLDCTTASAGSGLTVIIN